LQICQPCFTFAAMETTPTALARWLDGSTMTVAEFARRAGLTRQTLYNLMAGGTPTMVTALAIEAVTAGAVPLASWRPQSTAGR
jgi:predicted transcriptional regulator